MFEIKLISKICRRHEITDERTGDILRLVEENKKSTTPAAQVLIAALSVYTGDLIHRGRRDRATCCSFDS